MTLSGQDVLVQLLALTPLPPAQVEVELLIATFEAIVGRRAEVLAQLKSPLQLADTERAMLAELERRDAAWHGALAAALRTVGDRRYGVGKLRAYAR